MSVKDARKGANFGAFGGLRGAPSCNSPTRLTGGIPRREAPPECPSWRGGDNNTLHHAGRDETLTLE